MPNSHQRSGSETVQIVCRALLSRSQIIHWQDFLRDLQSNLTSSLTDIEEHRLCEVVVDNLEVMGCENPSAADLLVLEAKKRVMCQHTLLKKLWSDHNERQDDHVRAGTPEPGSLWRCLYDNLSSPRLWTYSRRDILAHDDRKDFTNLHGAYVAILLLAKELLSRLDTALNSPNLAGVQTGSQRTQELTITNVEHRDHSFMENSGASVDQNGGAETVDQSQHLRKSPTCRFKCFSNLLRMRDSRRDG